MKAATLRVLCVAAFFGFTFPRAAIGDEPSTAENGGAEKTIELIYLIQVNSWLALQPDQQYVITPNTTAAIPNACAFQLRVAMSF